MRMRWILPIERYEAYGRFMKTVNTSLGFSSSDVAQFRLRCVHILEAQGYQGVRLAFPEVSRRSVFRWQEEYRRSGKKLMSLCPASTRPHVLRQMVVPAPILSFLRATREQYPRLSKYKLKIFLDEFCRVEGLPTYSASWIGKVIKRNAFFFGVRKPVRKSRVFSGEKLRIWRCPRQADITLGYVQADGIKVQWLGKTLYFLCAVELKSRQAWAKRVPTLSSFQAKQFVESVVKQATYPIHTIQTDNGSEFHGYFLHALEEIKLTHVWSPPKSPRVNGYVERFNGVLQQEFIDFHVDLGIMDKPQFDELLADWVRYYNTKRPHHGLALMTPEQYLLHYQHQQSAKCV